MLKIFVASGVVLTVGAGWFFGLMATSSMKTGIVKTVVAITVSLIVGFGIAGLLILEYNSDVHKYNDGICKECETSWKLFDVEHHRNSGDSYYYICDNGHVIKTNHHFY